MHEYEGINESRTSSSESEPPSATRIDTSGYSDSSSDSEKYMID